MLAVSAVLVVTLVLVALTGSALMRMGGSSGRARALGAAKQIAAARERLAAGDAEGAEQLANELLGHATTDAECVLAYAMLADVDEVRGEFARAAAHLGEAWERVPKIDQTSAERVLERSLGMKRAFALAAAGRVDEAESWLGPTPARNDLDDLVALRARALVAARRGDLARVRALLEGSSFEASDALGPRSKLLLATLRARVGAGRAAPGGAYRSAGELPPDPAHVAWVERALGEPVR